MCAEDEDKDDDDEEGEGEVAATLTMLTVRGPHSSSCQRVHLDPSDHLVWSVLFLYPEHSQSDLIQAFREEERCGIGSCVCVRVCVSCLSEL